MYQQFSNNRIENYSQSLCCQPGYYSNELHYREFYLSPQDPAHRIVSMCYEAFPKKSQVSIPVIPDGCVDVVLAFQNDFVRGSRSAAPSVRFMLWIFRRATISSV